MALPGVAAVATYGSVLKDYSAISDSSTDRPAAGTNPSYSDVAAMTHTAPRLWVRMTLLSAGTTPTLVGWDAVWNNGINAAPVLARSSAGVFTITVPATVQDEVPSNMPGYIGPVTVNLRGGWANDRAGSTAWYAAKIIPTAANILTLYFYKNTAGTMSLSDPGANTDVDVFSV
jgi:hypothetical protein